MRGTLLWVLSLVAIAAAACNSAGTSNPGSTATSAAAETPPSVSAAAATPELPTDHPTIEEIVWQVPGVVWTDENERTNRFEIGMIPRRGGREEMEAALESVNFRRGSIEVFVGCEGSDQQELYLEERADEAFLSAVDYSLSALTEVSYGETVQLKLVLRNVSDEPVSFGLAGRPPNDFVVTTPDGEQVWHWLCAKIVQLPIDLATLAPGEVLEFTGEWEQVDNRGEPVPHGTYLVYGTLYLEPPDRIVTEARELVITR